MTIKERPILFSGPMVRAIPDGTKTQTRRVVKDTGLYAIDPAIHGAAVSARELERLATRCPYGQPGCRLWVKETFFAYGRWETRFSEKKGRDEWHFVDMTRDCGHAYQFDADNPDVPVGRKLRREPGWKKRPAIFMPRTVSRILLEIISVRVERLQDISDPDAIAEGLIRCGEGWRGAEGLPWFASPVGAYRSLWEHINGPGSWDANPWVWVVSFGQHQP